MEIVNKIVSWIDSLLAVFMQAFGITQPFWGWVVLGVFAMMVSKMFQLRVKVG